MTPEPSQNGTDSPLFHADSATLVFAAQKDGKIRVTGYALAKDYLAVGVGEVFEVRWGPQGVEGRVVARHVAPPVDGPDPFWVPDEVPTLGNPRGTAPSLQTFSAADIAVIKSAGGPVRLSPSARDAAANVLYLSESTTVGPDR